MGHRNISTTMIYAKVKTDTLKKAGSAFDQSRVSTKCPQEGNGVKLSTWELVTPRSTKLYQNPLIYQGFLLLSIPSPTLGPTLYCCLIGDLGCVFAVKAGAKRDRLNFALLDINFLLMERSGYFVSYFFMN